MSIDQARARFARVKFAEFLGVQIVDLAHERAVLKLPFNPAHMNPSGPLNGGASATLLNMAGAAAAWTGIDLDQPVHLSCVDMTVQYLSAALEEDVLAEARVLRRGRDLFFLDVALRTPENKPICQGLIIYRAPDYAGRSPRLWQRQDNPPLSTPPKPPASSWLICGYTQKMGVTVAHRSEGCVCMHMPCTAMHVDARGQMHDGALASIVDVAGTAAAWSLVPDRDRSRGSTVGMQMSYTHATSDPVVAEARLAQRSEELFFSTVRVASAVTGQLVAMGQVSYRLLESHGANATT